jgi:signal transduction histidine kinase
MLAALPVRLDPGPLASSPDGGVSSIRFSLLIAWGALALAMLAVGGLLLGVLSLSERRAAFVSAVTHELRTPLTTFRLYSEMLADGMVPDEERRRSYLHTLKVEADRLMHLVDNVLSYARLERTRPAARTQAVSVQDFLARASERLSHRAALAGLELSVSIPDDVRGSIFAADPGAVEQILFNLVDNAAKYAAGATDRTLKLEVSTNSRHVLLRVRDHGPGVAADERRRLFTPFHKSAREAAVSAPGVGLGLALCRRLARQMGGDLALDETVSDGAAFVLRLPAQQGRSCAPVPPRENRTQNP